MALRHRAATVVFALVVSACGAQGPVPGTMGGASQRATQSPTAPTTTASASPTARESASPSAGETPSTSAIRWSRLATAGTRPAPREDHTWTVDDAGRFAYLFGGRDGGRVFGDLWRFDLARDRWVRLRPPGAAPDARFGHTGTWVPGRGLVVWSGQRGTEFFNDLWLYRPQQDRWARLASNGAAPDARYGSCASLGPDGRLWISHGFTEDSGRFSDTRAYDFAAARWTEARPTTERPLIRCLHDCLWTPEGRLVLYAGQTSGVRAIGDLWSLTVDNRDEVTWTRSKEPPLAARNLYAVSVVGSDAFVFGGTPREGAKLDDTWRLDLDTLEWAPVRARGPSGRSGSAFVTDLERARLVLFGGQTDEGATAEAWELRLSR